MPDEGIRAVPDYHTKPVLAARVRPDNKSWATDEAKRRGQGVGDFLDTLLDAERDRSGETPEVCGVCGGKVRFGTCRDCGAPGVLERDSLT